MSLQLVLDVSKYLTPSELTKEIEVDMEGGKLKCSLNLDVVGAVSSSL